MATSSRRSSLRTLSVWVAKQAPPSANALSGQLDGATLFGELANDFRTRFITDIQKQIGQLFGAQFARDFQTAITQAQNIIAEASRGGTLLFDLDSGMLQDRINDAINAAAPGLRKLTGGDIFDLGGGTENKLVEQFRNVFTDASVALVTAGNESAAILERLQGVLSQGPGRSVSELTTQAAELRRLLVQASTSGATDAVRPVEQALRNVLSQLQQSGPPTAVQQIGNATQQATAAIDTSANRFASAVQSLVPAGREFASIISEAVGGAGVTAAIQTGAAQTIQRNVEVSIQNTDQIDVTLAGGANGNVLEEDEIRQIIDQTRDEMEADLEERLRRLEDELRSR